MYDTTRDDREQGDVKTEKENRVTVQKAQSPRSIARTAGRKLFAASWPSLFIFIVRDDVLRKRCPPKKKH